MDQMAWLPYIRDMYGFFQEQTLRLKSRKAWDNFDRLVRSLQSIQRSLGTIEHEVALNTLRAEFRVVRQDIVKSLKASVSEFWRYRSLAATSAENEKERNISGQRYLKDLQASIDEVAAVDPAMAQFSKELYEEFVKFEKTSLDCSDAWRAASHLALRSVRQQLPIYLRYLLARMWVFLKYHAWIFLVPVVIFSIGYAYLSTFAISYLTPILSQFVWFGPALVVLFAVFQKYFVDKKVKIWQMSLETRLYRPLSFQLFLTRSLALQLRTWREKPDAPSQVNLAQHMET